MTTTDVAPALEGAAAPVPAFASWIRRVVAWAVDAGAILLVAFLADGVVSDASFVPPLGGLESVAASAPWAWTAVLVRLVLQAWTGQTPGKRLVGIVVVREDDGRPLGLPRTLVREVAHVVDAIVCLLGYLRPLVHQRCRTVADSVVRSDVLRGDDPPGGPPMWWNATPRRALAVDVVVWAITAVVLLQLGGSRTGGTGPGFEGPFEVLPEDGSAYVSDVRIVDPSPVVVTRLGVSRTIRTAEPVRVEVTVESRTKDDGTRVPAPPLDVEVVVRDGDGAERWRGAAPAGGGEWQSVTLTVPRTAFDTPDASWAVDVAARGEDRAVVSRRSIGVAGPGTP